MRFFLPTYLPSFLPSFLSTACIFIYSFISPLSGLHISDLVSSLNCSDENPFNAACFQEAAATLPPDLAAKLSYLTKGAAGMALDGAISPWDRFARTG